MTVDRNRGLVRSGMSILSGYVLVLHDYDVLGGMLNPLSELVDVSVGVHGFDYGRGCHFYDFRTLDNGFQGDANGFSATGKNACGMDVAVDRGVVWNCLLYTSSYARSGQSNAAVVRYPPRTSPS